MAGWRSDSTKLGRMERKMAADVVETLARAVRLARELALTVRELSEQEIDVDIKIVLICDRRPLSQIIEYPKSLPW